MNAKSATFALQISFLLGMQLILGQEPPIHRRSTTAVRLPALPHMPGQVLTALATAEDEDPQSFGCGNGATSCGRFAFTACDDER